MPRHLTAVLLIAGALAGPAVAATATNYYWTNTVAGTTVESPFLWDDPNNWKDGLVPAGGQYDYIDFQTYGAAANTIWIKMPDDRQVVVGQIRFRSNGVKVRLFGGLGFKFKNNNSSAPDRNRIDEEPTVTSMGDRNIIFTPLYSEENMIQLKGVELACPVSFGFSDKAQLNFEYAGNRLRNLYAPCGGEVYCPYPGLSYLQQQNAILLSMPPNCPATNGCWVATQDSKIIKRISGVTGTTLAPGQYLHADGVIPEGAYVEYIYDGSYIGISQPALASSGDATVGTEISFDRHYSKLTQSLSTYRTYLANKTPLYLQRRAAENAYTFDIGELTSSASTDSLVLRTDTNDQKQQDLDGSPRPGIFRVKDFSGFAGSVNPVNGYIQFAGDTLAKNTLGKLNFELNEGRNQYYAVRLETPSGVEAKVDEVSNWITSGSTGALIDKVGAGTLTIKTSSASCARLQAREGLLVFDPTAAAPTLNSLTVTNGTCRIAENRNLTVSSLNVKEDGVFEVGSNSTVTVSGGTIACRTINLHEGSLLKLGTDVTIESGLTISGSGSVEGVGGRSGISFTDGVTVMASGSADNMLVIDTLSTNLPTRISPAFWVSAKATDSIIQKPCSTSSSYGDYVAQWNDCRGTPEQGYHFATNAAPGGYVVSDTEVGTHATPNLYNGFVLMRRNGTATTSLTTSPALVWDSPIRGIRAVFAVVDSIPSSSRTGTAGNYGGKGWSLLGSTERLSTCHFYCKDTTAWYNDRFDSAAKLCYNAPYYINGHKPPDGISVKGSMCAKPMMSGDFAQVVDVHPTGDAEADCWGYQRSAAAQTGACIGECLIYTNTVTEAERRQIENYLMAKWFGSAVVGAEVVPTSQDLSRCTMSGAKVNVNAGDAVYLETYTNGTGFVKTGAGDVYVKGLQTDGALGVRAGKVYVSSFDAKTGDLPAGAVLHIDANDDDSFPGVTEVASGEAVPKWIDTDDPSNPLYLEIADATWGKPVRKTDTTSFVRPMKVVDYGAFHNTKDSTTWKKGTDGWYGTANAALTHTVKKNDVIVDAGAVKGAFAVWGSAAGGNQVLGGYTGVSEGLKRNHVASTDTTGNINMSIAYKGGATDADLRRYASANLCFESTAYLNTREIDVGEDHPTGGYDVFSLLTPYNTSFSAIGNWEKRARSGGLQMGELLVYTRMLSLDEAKLVDAYLNWKWFGREPDSAYKQASVGTLDVAAGATLCITGNAPLKVSAMTGSGTVCGAVATVAGATFTVPVEDDGTITQTLTVSGSLDLSQGGTVRLTGNTAKLARGSYKLVASDHVGSAANWSVTGYSGRKSLKLVVKGDGLYLVVSGYGLVITIY